MKKQYKGHLKMRERDQKKVYNRSRENKTELESYMRYFYAQSKQKSLHAISPKMMLGSWPC